MWLLDNDKLSNYKMQFLEWFHLLREQSYPNLHGPVRKSNHHLNLITDSATIGNKNCNQMIVITGNEP